MTKTRSKAPLPACPMRAGVWSIGACSRCGYYGPDPSHACPNVPAEDFCDKHRDGSRYDPKSGDLHPEGGAVSNRPRSTTGRFARGQRVMRDMGIVGGHWFGIVKMIAGDLYAAELYNAVSGEIERDVRIPPGRLLVQFGGAEGMGIGFDEDDPYLSAVPDDLSTITRADEERRRGATNLDEPLWPAGYFGDKPR